MLLWVQGLPRCGGVGKLPRQPGKLVHVVEPAASGRVRLLEEAYWRW